MATHIELCILSWVFGYGGESSLDLIKEKGFCDGFTLMYIQAACAGRLPDFEKRLVAMDHIIHELRDIGWLKKPKEELFTREELSKRYDQIQTHLKLTPEELLDIKIFLGGCALYQSPRDTAVIAFLKENLRLLQCCELELSVLMQSKELEKKGGLDYVWRTNKSYTKKDLNIYLEQLSLGLRNTDETAIKCSCQNHAVAIHALHNGKFKLIDINNLGIRHKELSPHDLTNKLFDAFYASDGKRTIEMKIFTNTLNTKNIHLALQTDESKYYQTLKNAILNEEVEDIWALLKQEEDPSVSFCSDLLCFAKEKYTSTVEIKKWFISKISILTNLLEVEHFNICKYLVYSLDECDQSLDGCDQSLSKSWFSWFSSRRNKTNIYKILKECFEDLKRGIIHGHFDEALTIISDYKTRVNTLNATKNLDGDAPTFFKKIDCLEKELLELVARKMCLDYISSTSIGSRTRGNLYVEL